MIYIEKQMAINELTLLQNYFAKNKKFSEAYGLYLAASAIEQLGQPNVKEVTKASWEVYIPSLGPTQYYRCSKCGNVAELDKRRHFKEDKCFCSSCGSEMKFKEDKTNE